ncbi:peptidoglycan DD-metalloendopeptidase family protein [Rhizobium sp. 9140]|uniref:peptidoglycan DD-metalloendopeptidase family protein n=1 Tax=Rhizobium sp. 9140 TaxID=1761900 RepID=UPI000791446C|nr:peptidoglycan DD-metalloendopeptidase family protein [Rhizobium sp. 9140]CZT35124.1 Murein DD-endopeptidase MepM and murein hydrolase activator NlpD, contain LysM domain [Rhizobium sp. 9140]
MRLSVSSSVHKSVIRLGVAVLLASAASGCSSDSSRFGGLFSRSSDLTTNSIPSASVPVPRGDIDGSGNMPPMSNTRQAAVSQSFPDPVNATPVSRTRVVSTPMNVQRTTLAEPTPEPTRRPSAQPFPSETSSAQRGAPALATPDPVNTATVRSSSGWSTVNAPAVLMRQGDTTASLATRFGVPEKEILKANGLKRGSDAEPGQRILIPTYGAAGSAAKASASQAATALDVDKQKNKPVLPENRDVAILPTQTQSREKGSTANGTTAGKQPVAGEGDKAGTYTVKAGDSLNRIAKANGVSVDQLRAENGLTNGAIRVGQALKLPKTTSVARNTAQPGTDDVTTASVAPKVTAPKIEPKTAKVEQAKADASKPTEYTPAVAKQSVNEVAAKDDGSDAPKATGISKYRWPVRGAVVAGYGANVEGNRNDGINISVPEGTPIKAAENGVVIYSGSSLKELGNAVLVRHDDGTVTVYGNASELKVQRGQKIQRGQTLAASGMSGTATQPQVHFEVRKNATAVNPATYLE